MNHHYRVRVSLSPIEGSEIVGAVEVFVREWGKPEAFDAAMNGNQYFLSLTADGVLRAQEKPADLARRMARSIWGRLGRYVKVSVETTYLGELPNSSFEFGTSEYEQMVHARH